MIRLDLDNGAVLVFIGTSFCVNDEERTVADTLAPAQMLELRDHINAYLNSL